MAGAMMVTLVAISLPPVIERVEFATVVAQLRRLSKPHLKDQPTDTPEIRRERKRLADLTAYLDRYAARLIQGEFQKVQLWNSLQVIRDTTTTGLNFSTSAVERLAWVVWGWQATEKLDVVDSRARRLGPPLLVHPGQVNPFVEQMHLFSAQVVRYSAECHILVVLP